MFLCLRAKPSAVEHKRFVLDDEAIMSSLQKMETILKALADKSRLQMLDCIRRGITNPGEISRELNRHRSTVEKHLRVLLNAGIVQKVPSLTEQGQLSIRYKLTASAEELLTRIREACQKF
jgi:DNA-binding transcriptional ArsR family regulator